MVSYKTGMVIIAVWKKPYFIVYYIQGSLTNWKKNKDGILQSGSRDLKTKYFWIWHFNGIGRCQKVGGHTDM